MGSISMRWTIVVSVGGIEYVKMEFSPPKIISQNILIYNNCAVGKLKYC